MGEEEEGPVLKTDLQNLPSVMSTIMVNEALIYQHGNFWSRNFFGTNLITKSNELIMYFSASIHTRTVLSSSPLKLQA